MKIYDKIFTYISTKEALNGLDAEVLEKYQNSLIFIGDQKQIYQPLTNTYVGIGVDAFNELQRQITQSGNNLTAFNTYIHNDVVTTIYGQYNTNDLHQFAEDAINESKAREFLKNNTLGNSVNLTNYSYLSKTNRNVLIKGIYDYNYKQPYSSTYYDINIANDVVQYQKPAASYGTSGINVNVVHTGAWKRSNPTVENPYGFSYWEGQDILTIDDRLTWSYITQNTNYLKDYARHIAAEEANRIYHNLLGEDVEYVSKNLDNILYYNPEDNTIDLNDMYIKVIDNSNPLGYKFEKVDVNYLDSAGTGGADRYSISVTRGTTTTQIAIFEPSTGAIDIVNPSIIATTLGLYPNDGYIESSIVSGEVTEIIWYVEDPSMTSPYNYNLADGIQTIKEVAYILDAITDGDDAGISIAYSIKQNHEDIEGLKNWKNEITNPATSDFVTSFISTGNLNNFIVLNSFSTSRIDETKGDIHLDGDILLSYTYMLDGVKYAAYTSGQIPGDSFIRYINYYNIDDSSHYKILNDSNATTQATLRSTLKNKLIAAGIDPSASISLYTWDSGLGKFVESTSSIVINNLTSSTSAIKVGTLDAYIFFPYIEQTVSLNENGILDGITTVEWVTTYVGHGLSDLANKLNQGNTGAQQYTDQKIAALAYNDTEVSGEYVSEIDETNGIISVKRTKLPKDIIYTDQYISNQDDFTKVPYDEAHTLKIGGTEVYYINSNGQYQGVGTSTMSSTGVQYYIKSELPSSKFVLASTLSSAPTNINDLIGLNYNFFTKVIEGAKVSYIAVDLQKEITRITDEANLASTTPDYTLVTNPLYYIDFESDSYRFTKYIDSKSVLMPDGHTDISVSAYITYLSTSSYNNSGLADAYDVRNTIERMFTWVDLLTDTDFKR